MKVLYILFLLATLFEINEQLLIILEQNKEFCINKQIEKDDVVKASYVISGDESTEHSVSINIDQKIIDPNSKFNGKKTTLYTNSVNDEILKNQDDVQFIVENQSLIYYCFISDKKDAIVSFEIYTEKENGHILNLAKDGVFDEMYKNVTVIAYMFEEIEKNLKYFVERRDTHTKSKNFI